MIVNSLKCLFVLTAVLAAGQDAGGPKQIPLWPQAAPGEKGDIGVEADTTKPNGDLVAGRRVIRLGNVSVPTLAVYQPDQAKKTGAAVVVFPGGGYTILAMDLEGTEVCEWLNSIGVTGVLVKYRVPARKGMPRYAAPLQDAQRALGLQGLPGAGRGRPGQLPARLRRAGLSGRADPARNGRQARARGDTLGQDAADVPSASGGRSRAR